MGSGELGPTTRHHYNGDARAWIGEPRSVFLQTINAFESIQFLPYFYQILLIAERGKIL